MPPDCIFKVITKNGERTLFDGLSTARPSPTRRRRLWENREDESQGCVKQEADSSRTEITTSISNRVDLRIDGIPQEAILNDEIQMKDSNENFQKLQIGSQMQAICDDLNKRIFKQIIKWGDVQDGKCGIDWIEADHVHSPMSSLLETYSRTNGAVFMRELVSTRGAHGEPDRSQIRRTWTI